MPKSRFRPAGAVQKLPRISDAEWQVMSVIWARGQATTNEVVAALKPRTDWKPKTIHTLLNRLARKRALAFERKGREYEFRPLVPAEAYEQAATHSFLDRFFGGELAPFLARFVEREKLTRAQIAELKRILDRQ